MSFKPQSRAELRRQSRMAMVDISEKPGILREATATGIIRLKPETIQMIKKGKIAKGDPLYTSKIAAILAAKKTSSLIPLCHPLPITKVEVETEVLDESNVQVTATVKTRAQTGVEMEALTATAIGLLTIWDMVKQYEKNTEGQYPTTAIENIQVVKKIKRATGKKASQD
ncbi:MAG: cyclic pyranopterin monophosphate synthase MoaC [Candidatus Bathyarchaeia archaeon]